MAAAFQSHFVQLDAFQIPAGVLGDVDYTLDIDPGSYTISGAEIELFYSRTQTDAGRPKRQRRKTYVIKDRAFKLTESEAAEMLATEYIDAIREDVRVVFRDKKPVRITQTKWNQIKNDDEDVLLLL